MRKLSLIYCSFFYLLLSYVHASSLSINGSFSPFVIDTAVAGSQPSPAQSVATYSTSTSLSNAKITGKVNANFPTSTTMQILLTPPSGATSQGTITLSTTEQDLVTGIPIGTFSNLDITCTFNATVSAGTLSTTSRTLTLTLYDNG